jgi:hypothetical protein
MSTETAIFCCLTALAINTAVGYYLGSVKGYAQRGGVLGLLFGPLGWVLVIGGADLVRRRADAERDKKLDLLLKHYGVTSQESDASSDASAQEDGATEVSAPPTVNFRAPANAGDASPSSAVAWLIGVGTVLAICILVMWH